MAQAPEISFIICTYNRADYLNDTLRSIFQFGIPEFRCEILIIDNNSSDRTAEIVEEYKHSFDKNDELIRYILEPEQGLSHARNRGIKESEAQYIVFLDDDIKVTKSLLPAWYSFFTNNPQVVAAGGKIHVQFDDSRPRWMSYFLLPLLGYHDLGDSIKRYPATKYPFGGNMGFNKKIFDEVGYFDTELGRKGKSLKAGEEKDLFNRIRSRSYDLYYVPDSFLYHRVGAHRLSKEYIRNQAIGLGESMKMRLTNASTRQFFDNWIKEAGKLLASIPLGIFYLLILTPSKAKMLFLFRWWIWRGYFKLSS